MSQTKNQMKKQCLLILLLLLIKSSLVFSSQEADQANMLSDLKKYAAQQRECFDPIESNPKLQHLYEKLSLKIDNTNEALPNIKDPEYVADQDVEGILDWFVEAQKCQSKLIESLARIDPNWAILLTKQTERQAKVVNKIVSSRPSYGSINRIIVDIKATQRSETKHYSDDLIAKHKSKNLLEALVAEKYERTSRIEKSITKSEQKKVPREGEWDLNCFTITCPLIQVEKLPNEENKSSHGYENESSTSESLDKIGNAAVSIISSVLRVVLALAEVEMEIIESQAIYAAAHKAFVPRNIGRTSCQYIGPPGEYACGNYSR